MAGLPIALSRAAESVSLHLSTVPQRAGNETPTQLATFNAFHFPGIEPRTFVMNSSFRLRLLFTALVFSLPLFVSCGPQERKLVTVTGKITRGGQPVVVDKSKSQMIQVSFCEVDPSGGVINTFIGDVAENGTYSAQVPLAKLRVAVAFYDPYPMNDTLKDTFGQLTSKQMEDVEGPREINIELP